MKHRIISIILVFALVCMPLTALADAFTPSDYMTYYPDSYSYITGFATALNIGGGSLSSVNWSECDVTKSNESPMTYKNKGDDFTIVFDADSEKEEANYAQLAVTNQSAPGIYAFPFVATFMTYGHNLNLEDFLEALGWVASFEVEKPGKAGSTYETSSYFMTGVQPGDGHSLVITVVNKKSELSENFVELKKGSKGDAVKALQEKLNAAGYSVGSVDGDFGGKTATAISNYQKDMLLPQTGTLDLATYTLLNSDAGTAPMDAGQAVEQGADSIGWYVSDDGKYGIYPLNFEKNTDGTYTLLLQVREEATLYSMGTYELSLEGEEGYELYLPKENVIRDFVSEGNRKYSFDVACDIRMGTITIQRITGCSISL